MPCPCGHLEWMGDRAVRSQRCNGHKLLLTSLNTQRIMAAEIVQRLIRLLCAAALWLHYCRFVGMQVGLCRVGLSAKQTRVEVTASLTGH